MTSETVHWRDDGTPVSPRFGDIYRSGRTDDGGGGLAQARHVFLRGCGLLAEPGAGRPAVWADAAHWAVLETGFGLGLNFLATWQAWRQDSRQPQRLFYSAVEAFPPEVPDILRSVAAFPELAELAEALVQHWHGLLPGVHRIALDDEQVLLTLAVGDVQPALAELTGRHDAIFLDGFNPARNPQMWSHETLRDVARLAHPGARAATWCVAASVRQALVQCGFKLQRVPGLPPKRHALRARYLPPRHARASQAETRRKSNVPGSCAVIGGGLAGASAAWSLARRGWRVTVLDRAASPASGASGLPAGVIAPHVSPDDRPLSRLTRAGIRATLARAELLLKRGEDFAASGVLERHPRDKRRLPPLWAELANSPAMAAESLDPGQDLTHTQARQAGASIDEDNPALWHQQAGWARAAAMVQAMLEADGIAWRGGVDIKAIHARQAGWILMDEQGQQACSADLVIVAAGFDSLDLAGNSLPLRALRGQIAWGPMPAEPGGSKLPCFAVNGRGSLISHAPDREGGNWWITGSTFERGSTSRHCTPADHADNLQRLGKLLPSAAQVLEPQWPDGRAQAWAGVRATLPDHLPAVGPWSADHLNLATDQPADDDAADTQGSADLRLPLQLCTGMGARGLTFAVLCGELLAASLHDEPLPLARSLASCLGASRFSRTEPT